MTLGCDPDMDRGNRRGETVDADSKPSFRGTSVQEQRYVAGVAIPDLTLPEASGGDGTLRYRLTDVPGLKFDATTRTLSGTPTTVGTFPVEYWAEDADGDSDKLYFRIVAEAFTTMYWTSQGRIQRASLDGIDLEDLVTHGTRPYGVALDVAGGKIYWTKTEVGPYEGKIRRANLNGSNIEELVALRGSFPRAIALDDANRKMYWTELSYSETRQDVMIRRANLDGSGMEDLVMSLDFRGTSALEVAGGKIYWTEASFSETGLEGRIRRANLDGSSVEDLVTTKS